MTMQQTPRVKPTYGYYRQPDGVITLSPANDLDELKYIRMGWTALRQYGKFEVTSPYMAGHPLEGLFMAGGAHELTVAQIREQGLYMEPIKLPGCGKTLNKFHPHHDQHCFATTQTVVFPQIAGMDLSPYPCTFGCGRDLPTERARQQHESVAHAPEKGDERTGKSLAAALLEGLGGKAPEATMPPEADPSMMGAILRKMEDMQMELMKLKAAKTVRRRGPNKPKT